MSTPPSPTRCVVCVKAWALRTPDLDGGRRCFAHSTDPATIVKREMCAVQGKEAGAKQRGVPKEDAAAVLAGVVDIDTARAKLTKVTATKEAEKEAERIKKAGIAAIPLETKGQILGFLGRCAGELMHGGDPGVATAASSLARAALSALGAEDVTPPGEEVGGFRVERIDRTSKAKPGG